MRHQEESVEDRATDYLITRSRVLAAARRAGQNRDCCDSILLNWLGILP